MSQHRFNQFRLFFPLVFRFLRLRVFSAYFRRPQPRAPCVLAFLRRWLAYVHFHRHVPHLTRLMSIYANETWSCSLESRSVGGGIEFARLRTSIKQPRVNKQAVTRVAGRQRATICSIAGFNLCNSRLR